MAHRLEFQVCWRGEGGVEFMRERGLRVSLGGERGEGKGTAQVLGFEERWL